jgi:hypothetical protein
MTFYFFMHELLEPISYGLCFLFFLVHLRKNNEARWRSLATYYFTATLLMIKSVYSDTNIEIYSLLGLLTSICLGLYFYYILFTPWKKWLAISFSIIGVGYYITNTIVLQNIQFFDSTGYAIVSISIVLMAFMYMHQLLTNITEEPLLSNLDFWFVSSQLIYHLGSFFIFLTYGYLTQQVLASDLDSRENRIYLTQLWRIHNVLLFLSALIISTGVLWISSRRRSPSL